MIKLKLNEYKGMAPVHLLLREQMMQPADVDSVVLVGGASRMPRTRKLLADLFGESKIRKDIDPDVTVAYGAASVQDGSAR
jgi:molecular chaperone DnaK (HSP70)